MHHGRSLSSSSFYASQQGFGQGLEEDEEEFDNYGTNSSRVSSSTTSSPYGIRTPRRDRTGSESFEQNDYKEEVEVGELLTKAAVTSNEQLKYDNLVKVKEIIVNRQPALLDNFLDEMLNFQLDNCIKIRKYILDFIHDACTADAEIIPKILHNMLMMLNDPVVSVQKKAVQVTGRIYALTLIWLCRAKNVTEEMEAAWSSVNDLKKLVISLIDSDNDAIRTHTVKFIESIILLQTPIEPEGIKRKNEFSLDQVPITVRVARPRKLEEDARALFDELLKFHGSRHATSVNLMTCMGSIVLIAKLRPIFTGRVVSALEKLNAILPPTLERSQVQSVRKHMKVQLMGLLKQSSAADYQDNITTLLTDLGATHSELSKAIPNWDEIRIEKRKRQREKILEKESVSSKRQRVEVEVEEEKTKKEEFETKGGGVEEEEEEEEYEDDYDDDEEVVVKKTQPPPQQMDHVEEMLFNKLTPAMTVELVIAFMDRLPNELPAHFNSAYTPVAIAGQDTQVRHVARLLAAQITELEQGPGSSLIAGGNVNVKEAPIPTLITQTQPQASLQEAAKALLVSGSTNLKKKIIKTPKLSEITKPLSPEERDKQLFSALYRILRQGENLGKLKEKIISSIMSSASTPLRKYVMGFIREDVKNRFDIGLQWLYEEYSLYQGFFHQGILASQESAINRYEWTFLGLMHSILENTSDHEKSLLSWRLYMEPPLVPDKGVDMLESLCSNINIYSKGIELIKELTLKRPKKLHYLSILLAFCSHSNDEIRSKAVRSVLDLYEIGEGVKIIEDKAVNSYMSSLKLPSPPEILFIESLGRPHVVPEWNEELAKASLHLYLQLVDKNNKLLHKLSDVYLQTVPDVKRNILRQIEPQVKKMGMESEELMKFIDSFPKGCETLVTRVIHILTDKVLPSKEIVNKVRSLYNKRIFDVRFLIPVLNGLTKAEIITALPKLIQLNPNVVKEVFNRLLGIHADAKSQHTSPITPEELMIELHCMENSKCDIKSIIRATSICFSENEIYTQEVLGNIINKLLDHNPLPTLLMRTVIQTLNLHPKLLGFVMNILARLIKKQAWTQPKIWEGFIKCCQRTLPKSVPVLLLLPHPQLKIILEDTRDLREAAGNYVMTITEQQRSQMSPQILDTILSLASKNVLPKNENYYGYESEVTPLCEVQSNHTMSSNSFHFKNPPRSPGGTEPQMKFKSEPMDYNTINE